MARPTSRTPETEAKLVQAFSMGSTISGACFYADIAESTYYDWASKDPVFSEEMQAHREKPILKALQTVMKDMDSPMTAKWYLERRHSDFKPKQEIKHDGGIRSLTNEMTLEEAEQIYADNVRALRGD